MASNKKGVIIGLVMMVCFGAISCILLYSIFKPGSNSGKKKGSETLVLQEYFGKKFASEADEFSIMEQTNSSFLIVSQKYDDYYKPCFDFIITRAGVKILRANSKDFFTSGFEADDIITKIDNINLASLKYAEIVDLLYCQTYQEKCFYTSSGKTIKYTYKKLDNTPVITKNDGLTIKLYNLDYVSESNIYKLCKEYNEVIFDLSNVSIGSLASLRAFVSLFSNDDELIFKDINGIRALKVNAKVNFILGNNKDAYFIATALKNKSNISFDYNAFKEIERLNYAYKTIDLRFGYNLIIYDKYVEII